MEYIDYKMIISFFETLNDSKLRYVLVRNTGEELPYRLQDGKDIDLLIHHEDVPAFMKFMKQENFQRKIPPYGKLAGWNLAYQVHDFLFYKKKISTCQFYVDVCQELCCHSTMKNVWIPLDRKIQEDIWKNRWFDHERGWWCLDEKTAMIAYLTKAIFDKCQFSPEYIESIESRLYLLDDMETREKFELIFFKYTERLIEMLKREEFDKIIIDYYGFKNY